MCVSGLANILQFLHFVGVSTLGFFYCNLLHDPSLGYVVNGKGRTRRRAPGHLEFSG